jgi:hypothetical protein
MNTSALDTSARRTGGSASHRSVVLLLILATAIRALSYSRGNLNEIGLSSFSLVLVGLILILFVRGPWQAPSETRGGVSLWKIALPCAYLYVFAVNSARYLMSDLGSEWEVPLQWLSAGAAIAALPVLLLTLERARQRLSGGWQITLLVMPLLPVLIFFLVVPVASPAPVIDVFFFQLQAAQELLAGRNPYETEFLNLYGEGASLYPSGTADSYPYPPLSFAFALLGLLLGDIRWPLIACHIAAAVLLCSTSRARGLPWNESIIFAALFLYLPYSVFVSEQAWTDPTAAMSLGLMSLFLARRQPRAALWAAGLALACKQTMALLVPLLWAMWRSLQRAHLLAVFSFSAVTYGIFLLWNASALWNDVVTFHLLTPARPRALTYSGYVYYLFDFYLPTWFGLVGLVSGVLAAVLGLLRADPDTSPCDGDRPWRFFSGLAFAYLLTALLSKHAFMNYYYLVYFALVAALVWSRIADLEATSDSHSPTSRVNLNE